MKLISMLGLTLALLWTTTAFAQESQAATQTSFEVLIENIAKGPLETSAGPVPFSLSPGVWVVHTGMNPIYAPFHRLEGQRGEGLENLAEDGKQFEELVGALQDQPGVKAAEAFNMPESKMEAGGLTPGMMYRFTILADPGDHLSVATMFAESNDLFYAPYGVGIPLFHEDGTPVSGDVTSMIALWDAGTEENQEPGVGEAQPHRQPEIGFGPQENLPVRPISAVNDTYSYPATSEVIRVTITPVTDTAASAQGQQRQQGASMPEEALRNLQSVLQQGIDQVPTPQVTQAFGNVRAGLQENAALQGEFEGVEQALTADPFDQAALVEALQNLALAMRTAADAGDATLTVELASLIDQTADFIQNEGFTPRMEVETP